MPPGLARPRPSSLKFVIPQLTGDRGAPSKRGEGASRGCSSPVAFVPQYQRPAVGGTTPKPLIWAKTTQARPTFTFYFPFGHRDVAGADLTLMLQDRTGKLLYQLPVTLPATAGVITVAPAISEPALVMGEIYTWALRSVVACTDADQGSPKIYWVGGQIERQSLDLQPEINLASLSLREQAQLHAEQGFWFEALGAIAQLRQRQPETAQSDWRNLLTTVGLETYADEPLVESLQTLYQGVPTRVNEAQ